MNLFINSPAYYSQFYGADSHIDQMCRLLEKNIDIKEYTDSLDSIGITPIIAPQKEIDDGKYKELKLISKAYRYASISLHIDFLKYKCSSVDQKKRMILGNVLCSLLLVKKKIGTAFNYEKIESDILSLFNMKFDELVDF